jgi:minor extracellular serine protease Vpr
MKRLFKLLTLAAAITATLTPAAEAGPFPSVATLNSEGNHNLPAGVIGLKLPKPRHVSGVTLEDLGLDGDQPQGRRQVIIHLKRHPVARLPNSRPPEKAAQVRKIEQEQRQFLERWQSSASEFLELARLQLVLNAIIAEVDAATIANIVKDPAVSQVSPVMDYELALSETVPYIGAPLVHDLGVDGSGIRVAVIDSGIDYTHFNLGGAGSQAAYDAAYGADPADPKNTTTDGLFPTDKVIGGYDFLGEFWPSGPLVPDPDPIDFNGHGTHVADIIGGRKGVAPGVEFYALKVCASLVGSCSGAALIQAMEFAVDPNGDGNTDDHVDIVNMSLGSDYGQPFDDSLSAAVDNATRLGVLTVASAGNGSDRPYVTGTPAAAATAISVAQTQVPSAFLPTMAVVRPAEFSGEYQAAFQPWSAPLSAEVEGPVQYADGQGGNLNGCMPFAPGSLDGKIVVVDRGACFFSDKVRHIQQAGGILGIIAMVEPGPPFPGGFGGGSPITIPAYMVGKADGDILRRGDTVIRLAPGQGTSLAGSVVDTSSRGPEFQTSRIKPELAAPGASVSAEPGTGTGERPFSGTSGAAPMVAGSAALLMHAHIRQIESDPDIEGLDRVSKLSPLEVKARLMNTAEADLWDASVGSPTPISRVGSGEVRIDRAVKTPVAAWDAELPGGALSFGFMDVADENVTLTRRVLVRNYSKEKLTFRLGYSYQFDDDAANGAVSLSLPNSISVEGKSDTVFLVTMNIDGTGLRDNLMNSGPQGDNPAPLTINEYDGYITMDSGKQVIRLVWHVLPRKAARLLAGRSVQKASASPGGTHTLLNSMVVNNSGVGMAQNEAYSLLALSPRLPSGGRGEGAPTPDLRAVGFRTFDVPGGFCSDSPSYVVALAVNTWERQTHANWPGIYGFYLDADQDGSDDYLVFNSDAGLETGAFQGQNVTWVLDAATGDLSSHFFTEHAMNTANTVLYLCAEQIGSPLPLQEIDAFVLAVDAYFGGPGDSIPDVTFAPFGDALAPPSPPDVPAGGSDVMGSAGFTEDSASPREKGLLVFTNSDRGPSSRGGATADTEALIFIPPSLDPTPPSPSALGGTQPETSRVEPVSAQ